LHTLQELHTSELFWMGKDLEVKLNAFKQYYNRDVANRVTSPSQRRI